MIDFIKRQLVKDDKLIWHTALLTSASTLGSLFNYIFHVYAGRRLGPEMYGTFGSLMSFTLIISIIASTFFMVYSRFVADRKSKKKYSEISFLFRKSLFHMAILGMIVFFIIILISPILQDFLKISHWSLFLIIGLFSGLNFLYQVINGTINGLQKFVWQSFIGILGPFFKLCSCIILISLGFDILGALGAIVAGMIPMFVFGFIPIKKIMKIKPKKINLKKFYKQIGPVLLAQVLPILLINIDILLVKHFFQSTIAGYYVATSNIARIVWFFSGSINFVILPKVSGNKKSNKKILVKSLLIAIAMILPVLLIYILFPGFVSKSLYGGEYQISQYIVKFSIGMAIYSLMNILIVYNIARRNMKFIFVLLLAVLMEIILISLFHSQISSVINIVIFVITFAFGAVFLHTVKNG